MKKRVFRERYNNSNVIKQEIIVEDKSKKNKRSSKRKVKGE